MKISGEHLRRLAALNLPGEAFQEVLTIIADMSSNDDERRERQRLRRAKYPRHTGGPKDGLSDGPRDGKWDGPPPAYTTPPKNSEPKKVLRSMRKIPLPSDWKPSEENVAFARSKSWDDQKIAGEAERFRDHALAGGRKQLDWGAAWRNWVTSPYQQPQKNGNGNEKSIVAACDRFIAQNGGMEAAREYVPGSSGPAPLDLDRLKGKAGPKLISSR